MHQMGLIYNCHAHDEMDMINILSQYAVTLFFD